MPLKSYSTPLPMVFRSQIHRRRLRSDRPEDATGWQLEVIAFDLVHSSCSSVAMMAISVPKRGYNGVSLHVYEGGVPLTKSFIGIVRTETSYRLIA